MIFLFTLIVVIILSILLSYINMRKNAHYIYLVAVVINIVGIYFSLSDFIKYDGVIYSTIMKIMKQGLIGMSFIVVVMMIGALNKSKIVVNLFKIRGELSILGVIFMLNHFVYYMVRIIKAIPTWSELSRSTLTINLLVSLLSIWAWIICIPLFITSFKLVRKRMDAKKWKQLQRYAYIMYALVYIHIMLAFISKPDIYNYIFDITVYSLIFLIYFCLRIRLYLVKKKPSMKLKYTLNIIMACMVILFISFGIVLFKINESHNKNVVAQKELEEMQRKEIEKKLEEQINDNSETIFNDGEYIGEAEGYNAKLSVKVNIKNDQIISIEFVDNKDDEAYVEKAKFIFNQMIINNTTNVDVVSGATITSKAIIKATEDALAKAEK